jgi:predicted nucleotidyltransferase
MNENYHLSSLDIDKLAQRFDKADVVQALILMGSYARNEAGPNSDIDLIRFVIAGTKLSDNGTIFLLMDYKYVLRDLFGIAQYNHVLILKPVIEWLVGVKKHIKV